MTREIALSASRCFFVAFALFNIPSNANASQVELCGIISSSRNESTGIIASMQTEINPIRKQQLQSQLNILHNQLKGKLDQFFGREKQFENYRGTVTETRLDLASYFLTMMLDCPGQPVELIVWFSSHPDLISRGAGNMNQFRDTLSNINRGDQVRVAGRFYFSGIGNTYPVGDEHRFRYVFTKPAIFSAMPTSIGKERK